MNLLACGWSQGTQYPLEGRVSIIVSNMIIWSELEIGKAIFVQMSNGRNHEEFV